MTDVCIVLTTLDDPEKARQLGQEIVERRLAACVNVGDRIHSIYRWRGAVEANDEVLLIIKTARDRLPELKAAIQELHPYELPEILVFDALDGGAKYLDWMLDSCRSSEKRK